MLNQKDILSTIEMIDQQHLDIRTITMGIFSLIFDNVATNRFIFSIRIVHAV